MSKYPVTNSQHQPEKDLYHVSTHFKKAFDRVWQEALRAAIRKFNINGSVVRATERLKDKAALFNGTTGQWFRITVRVRQGVFYYQ